MAQGKDKVIDANVTLHLPPYACTCCLHSYFKLMLNRAKSVSLGTRTFTLIATRATLILLLLALSQCSISTPRLECLQTMKIRSISCTMQSSYRRTTLSQVPQLVPFGWKGRRKEAGHAIQSAPQSCSSCLQDVLSGSHPGRRVDLSHRSSLHKAMNHQGNDLFPVPRHS